MHDGAARLVGEPPSRGAQAPGEIDILPVHEDGIVEAIDGVVRGAAKQRGGPAHPGRVEGRRIVGLRVFVGDLAHLPGGDARVVAGRDRHEFFESARLDDAVLVDDQEPR